MSTLGQAAAILYGTTAPSNTDVIWAKTSTNDPGTWVIEGYYQYLISNWELINGVHYASIAPVDTKKIWLDVNFDPPLIKTYNGSSWEELTKLRSVDKSTDFTLSSNENNTLVKLWSNSKIVITVEDPGVSEFQTKLIRVSPGIVELSLGAGVNINGSNESFYIKNQWQRVILEKIDTNEFQATVDDFATFDNKGLIDAAQLDATLALSALGIVGSSEDSPIESVSSNAALSSSTAFTAWAGEIGDIYSAIRYLAIKVKNNDSGNVPTLIRLILKETNSTGSILVDVVKEVTLTPSAITEVIFDFGEVISGLSGQMLWLEVMSNGNYAMVGSSSSADASWTKTIVSAYRTNGSLDNGSWTNVSGGVDTYYFYCRAFQEYKAGSLTASAILKSAILGGLSSSEAYELLLALIPENELWEIDKPLIVEYPTAGTSVWNNESSIFSGWGCPYTIISAFKFIKVRVRSWDGSNPITNVNLRVREAAYNGAILAEKTLPIADADADGYLLFTFDSVISYGGVIWLDFSTDGHSGFYGVVSDQFAANGQARYRVDKSLTGLMGPELGGTSRLIFAQFYDEDNAKLSPAALEQVTNEAINPALIPNVYLNLPPKLYAVKGYTSQIFFRGIIEDIDPYRFNIKVTGDVGGKQFPRYYEFTPTATGIKTLTISIYDRDDNLVSTKSCTVEITEPNGSPASAKRILCLGDSLTNANVWPTELNRMLTGTGGSPTGLNYSNIDLIGTRGVGTNHEGYGGKTWIWFTSNVLPDIVLTATAHGKDSNDLQSIWQDGSSNQYRLESVDDANTLTFSRVSHSNSPSASGTFTHVSGAGNTSNISYSSFTSGDFNPFWNQVSDELDISNYVTTNGFGSIDLVIALLSWNGQGANRSEVSDHQSAIDAAKLWLDALHTDFPDCKVKLLGIPLPSLNGGLGDDYGDANSGYGNYYDLVRTVFGLNKAYEALAEDVAYSDFVEFIDVATQFDNENNMPDSDTPVNSRSIIMEKRGTNGVHPKDEGYYQIADVGFRSVVAELL